MCDISEGQLILCFPKLDVAGKSVVERIKSQEIEHVSYIESMDDKLKKVNLSADPDVEFDLHLVGIPPGQENWKITYLQFFWKLAFLEAIQKPPLSPQFIQAMGRSDYQFTVAPNHRLTLAASPGANLSAGDFQFGPLHTGYKKMLGYPLSSRLCHSVRAP
jgi:hypothetical protein